MNKNENEWILPPSAKGNLFDFLDVKNMKCHVDVEIELEKQFSEDKNRKVRITLSLLMYMPDYRILWLNIRQSKKKLDALTRT